MSADFNSDRSFKAITEKCLDCFRRKEVGNPMGIVCAVMDDPSFPMHNFAHHYLVPAVLFTEAGIKSGMALEKYESGMAEIAKRAKNVLPAFCGFYGACGAAVGCGIFTSVFTGATPLSKDTWALCNYATAGALEKMAEMGGPRCCKRNTFAALLFMKKYVYDNFSIAVDIPDAIACRYSRFNTECIKDGCPFFEKAERTGTA